MADHYATALNPKPSYGDRFGKTLFRLFLLSIPLGGLVTAVMLCVIPKKYESRAAVYVYPSSRLNTVFRENGSIDESIELFFSKQTESIRSHKIYAMVSQKLDLPMRWNTSEQDAIRQLDSIVNVQRIRESDIFGINVTHASAKDARDIAQTIYECYREQKNQEERNLAESALNELQKAIFDYAAVVEKKRAQREELLKKAPPFTREDLSASASNHSADSMKMLEEMKAKLESDKMNLNQIYHTVELYEAPVIATSPIPSRMFSSLLCGIVGLPLTVLLVGLPLTGIMHRASRGG